ncbi:anhydro-N-acetylmuramic acid kinase [Cohaesibacter gelatinilyticus]|uniref:Anhydro-N-acetylmuramic acid kinase n=1 Tax=Cohaesibacter gelatinilyticus TaxID=372072 RepID=A0A285NEX3_9HYPH|nr:anhydro-N-acetylmuramic acid kinase [Cohaesibacter gelatinilyticus]SNZ07999.1 anhydro-N-acetylmuramic acid kinase [Cohaesibacter gelatinilyticus]
MQKKAHLMELEAPVLALGLMSGTSCDGVDLALIRTDGEDAFEPVANGFHAYSADQKALLGQAIKAAKGMEDRTDRSGVLAEAEALVTQHHIEAAQVFLDSLDENVSRPDLIGFHGQTVWHDPAKGVTVQLGDGEALSNILNCPVVFDLRANDMEHGGEGAPMVPAFHRLLAAKQELLRPCAFVNIGGVSNITWIGSEDELTAFDCGPGNALIDDLVRRKLNKDMDEGGRLAMAGQVDFLALVGLIGNPYFQKRAPKSLDRNAFDASVVESLGVEDAVATLTAFTVETICLGLEQMEQLKGEQPTCLVVCGGGQHNPAIIGQLQGALDCEVRRADDLGLQGDALEAQAFAYLAVRSSRGLPLTFPGTTGVHEPVSGGVMVGG